MSDLISFFESKKIHNEHLAHLAIILADSGKKLKFDNDILVADIPSTGGPSSLSTVLCPLFLSQFDIKIPKIGIAGHPAGGIDILAQIPDYRIHYAPHELNSSFKVHNYIHFLADNTFCPLDVLLFNFRKKINKVNVIPLVIASILSKKIAAGVNHVGLEIRVWDNGNFGTTREIAKKNAFIFREVAALLGIYSKCFLSDIRFPLQPYIGRGEGLLAINELLEKKENITNRSLYSHLNVCRSMALSLIDKKTNTSKNSTSLKVLFEKNLMAQGSSYTAFLDKINKIEREKKFVIKANKSGYLNLNLFAIRSIIVNNQSLISTGVEFPDDCGFQLLRDQGDFVRKNEPIINVRLNSTSLSKVQLLLYNTFAIQNFLTLNQQYEEIK